MQKDSWTIEFEPSEWHRLLYALRNKTVTEYEIANDIVEQIQKQMKGKK